MTLNKSLSHSGLRVRIGKREKITPVFSLLRRKW